jgi:hypothetical protein
MTPFFSAFPSRGCCIRAQRECRGLVFLKTWNARVFKPIATLLNLPGERKATQQGDLRKSCLGERGAYLQTTPRKERKIHSSGGGVLT